MVNRITNAQRAQLLEQARKSLLQGMTTNEAVISLTATGVSRDRAHSAVAKVIRQQRRPRR